MSKYRISPVLAARLLAEQQLRQAETARPGLRLEPPPEPEALWQTPPATRRPAAWVLDADGKFSEIDD